VTTAVPVSARAPTGITISENIKDKLKILETLFGKIPFETQVLNVCFVLNAVIVKRQACNAL